MSTRFILFVDAVEQVTIIASKGETVELPCWKQGTKRPIIAEWKFEKRGQTAFRVSSNGWIFPRFRRRFSVKSLNNSAEGDFSLRIEHVTRYDVGVYICIVAHQSSEMMRFLYLDVTGEMHDGYLSFYDLLV